MPLYFLVKWAWLRLHGTIDSGFIEWLRIEADTGNDADIDPQKHLSS